MKYGYDPTRLLPPADMEQSLISKVHAEIQLEWIDGKLKEFRKLRRLWNARLGVCLESVEKIAIAGTAEKVRGKMKVVAS